MCIYTNMYIYVDQLREVGLGSREQTLLHHVELAPNGGHDVQCELRPHAMQGSLADLITFIIMNVKLLGFRV